MVNLTKKLPYRRNDLIYAYDAEGKWVGEVEVDLYFDEDDCLVYKYWWDETCVSGNEDDCSLGSYNSGGSEGKIC